MPVRKSGLGRGLDSLIPAQSLKKKSEPTEEKNNITAEQKIVIENASDNKQTKKSPVTLRISEIEPNRKQPRKKFDEDSLTELAESIRQYGILQPLLVQKRDQYYEIIAGERRWRAAKMAGIKEIPVIIKDFTEEQIVEIALIENIQREDLNPIEEALAYQRLLEDYHLKQEDIAEKVAKSRSTVTNAIRLLKLDERVQQMLAEEMITVGQARPLIVLEDYEKQYQLAMKIFDEKLSARETEKIVQKLQKNAGKQENSSSKDQETDTQKNTFIYEDIEEKIKTIFGTKVVINHKKNHKGKIEISYFSDEELERILYLIQSIKMLS